MEKNEIIEFLGSEKIYEEYRKLVIDELNKQINDLGLAEKFEGTDVYTEFADFYIQSWMHSNKRFIDEVHKLQNKVFSEEEIEQYINENPIVPEYIQNIMDKELMSRFFKGQKISTEEQQQKDNYFKNPQLLSKDEAKTMMTRENQKKIDALMKYFDLQQFKDDLDSNKDFGFLDITSNPKDFDIGPIGLKKVLKENTGSKPSMSIQPENEHCDFDVNADQIVIAGTFTSSVILAYITDQKNPKKYPEGMLRSELIEMEKRNSLKSELINQYKQLWEIYGGQLEAFKEIWKSIPDESEIINKE